MTGKALLAAFALTVLGSSAAAQEPAASGAGLPISIPRVRFGLEQPTPSLRPAARPIAPEPYSGTPTFRVTIVAPRAFMVPIAESLAPGWEPAIPGGRHHKEFLDLVTPPQARPYGAFQNGDLVQVVATSMANALLMSAAVHGVKQALAAARKARAARIRGEVERELKAVQDAAARAAAAERPSAPPVPEPRYPW